MRKNRRNKKETLEVFLKKESFASVDEYIKEEINSYEASREILADSLGMINALMENMIDQGFTDNTTISLKVLKSFGEIKIRIDFFGKPFEPILDEETILKENEENIYYKYRSGHNTINLIVKRSYNLSFMRCFGSIVLAVLTYLILDPFVSVETQLRIEEVFIYPLVKMFSNAILMVGGPVTLFSLLKNLSDTYIEAEKTSSGRKLQIKTYITSIISILIAIATYFILYFILNSHAGYLSAYPNREGSMFVSDIVQSLIPSSIVEPFISYNPFPMILAALLTTYSLCSVGKYFGFFKRIIDAGYALFSRMMNIVMYAMPVFCYLSFLTPLLAGGLEDLVLIFEMVLLVYSTLISMAIFYLVRLKIGGVKIRPFLKGLPKLLRENLRINSAIDAIPFNARYCCKTYGYNKKRFSQNLRILSQINLDGNCCLLMIDALILILLLGVRVPWYEMAVIIFLVFFLSLGAPNQPGTILIGTLIIIYMLKADELISMAIYLELFLGASQNMVNVMGDIVTAAIEEQKSA